MSGPGKWKKHRWKGSKEPVIADIVGMQMKRRKRKVVPSTEAIIYTECAVDSRDETNEPLSVAVPEVVPVFREAAPTTTQDSTLTNQPGSEDDITISPSSDTTEYEEDSCLKPNSRSANIHTGSTLHSEDSPIHNPTCHGADDLLSPLSTLTHIPNVSSKYDSSLLTRKSIILRHDSAPILAVAHIDPSPSSHMPESMSQDADNDSVISDSEKSQDTVILSPSSQDTDFDESKPLLTSMITPMPTFYSDLLTSVRANKSKLFPQDTTPRQLHSNDESNVRAAFNSQDTLIINPAWQDSQEDFEALPSLTPMPSVYSELESSFRTNETIMAHRNLTLLLATTRIAISHDETRLSQLDMDISRLKRELQVKTTTFERMARRSMYINKTVSALCE